MRLVPLLAVVTLSGLLLAGVFVPSARRWAWKAQAALALLLVVSGAYLGLWWVAPDEYMGEVQRIMYVHVPVIWVCILALVTNFLASVTYLLTGRAEADGVAEAVAEVGLAFGCIGVSTGALWGRPTWGVWWAWDPRMLSTTFMLLLYTSYLGVRFALRRNPSMRLWAASLACAVSAVLPVVWFSVKWWSSLHQMQSNASTMDPTMLMVLTWNGAAVLGLFLVLAWHRFHLARPRPS